MAAAATDASRDKVGVRWRILAAATAEFLDRGFAEASLRHIASEAGVTTGAIYGYFASKSDLFDAIVRGPEEELFRRYAAAHERFSALPAAEQSFEQIADAENDLVSDLYDYVFEYREAFLLLTTRASGTRWERFIDRYLGVEAESTDRYVRDRASVGVTVNDVEAKLSRTLVAMYFSCFFKPLELGLSREQAGEFMVSCNVFFHAGYRALMDPARGSGTAR